MFCFLRRNVLRKSIPECNRFSAKGGVLWESVTDKQLCQYLMSVTEIFYSTSGCIKKAALIIGRQPGSEIYVLGDKKKRCRYSITVFTKFFTTAVYVSWPNQNSKYAFKLPSHSLLIVDNFLVNYRCLKLWHNYNKKLWIIWTWDFSIAKLNLFSQLFQQFFYSWMVMVN